MRTLYLMPEGRGRGGGWIVASGDGCTVGMPLASIIRDRIRLVRRLQVHMGGSGMAAAWFFGSIATRSDPLDEARIFAEPYRHSHERRDAPAARLKGVRSHSATAHLVDGA